MHQSVIAVVGAGSCERPLWDDAHEVGRLLAEAGQVVATGGLGGVMEAASAGAEQAGGTVIGILPGPRAADANPHVTVPIATGLGEARSAVLVHTARGLIAVGGEYGTLSEIAFALKAGKPVIGLHTWDFDARIQPARSPAEAVRLLLKQLAEVAAEGEGEARDVQEGAGGGH